MKYSKQQLEQLASNPKYVLSDDQAMQLEQYRTEEYEQSKKQNVKHSNTVVKHETGLKDESRRSAN